MVRLIKHASCRFMKACRESLACGLNSADITERGATITGTHEGAVLTEHAQDDSVYSSSSQFYWDRDTVKEVLADIADDLAAFGTKLMRK